MIKIPLSLLEEARTNTKEIVDRLSNQNRSFRGRYSKFQAWKNAAISYHKSKSHNLNHIIASMENSLKKNFKTLKNNPKALQEYTDKLELYVEDHHRNNFHFIESINRFEIRIGKSNVIISGQIPIINMIDNNNYGVIFFTKKETIWEQELKFPLLQYHFAKSQYKCDLSQVFVGVYCFETDRHYIQSFNRNTIIHTLTEVADIASAIEADLSAS